MREVAIKHLREGMHLARPIRKQTGTLILNEHVELNTAHIRRIHESGVSSVWVEDRFAADLQTEEVVRPELHPMAAQLLADFHEAIRRKAVEKEAQKFERAFESLVAAMVEDLWATRDAEFALHGSRSLTEYETTHPFNAALLTILIGLRAGANEQILKRLGMAALLQNVGQALVPDELLLASRPLSPEERSLIEQHPQVGVQILRVFAGFDSVMQAAVHQHHERMDGSGYPRRLAGNSVLQLARAVAIGDVYDALISQRPYRDPYARHEAMEFILAFAGELFDLSLADTFARSVPSYLPGTIVQLDNGEKGIVINANRGLVGRPTVRICFDTTGNELPVPREVDLARPEHQSLLVASVLPDWK